MTLSPVTLTYVVAAVLVQVEEKKISDDTFLTDGFCTSSPFWAAFWALESGVTEELGDQIR